MERVACEPDQDGLALAITLVGLDRPRKDVDTKTDPFGTGGSSLEGIGDPAVALGKRKGQLRI